MSRRLTGTITPNPQGTFTASLPVRKGERRRISATFDTRSAAARWRDEGIAVINGGGTVQRPTNGRRHQVSAGTSFLSLAREFIAERYAEDGHGDIDREEQVLGYARAIDGYMTDAGLTVESMSRRDARAMWQHMLKTGPRPVDESVPDGLDPARLVTQRQALALLAGYDIGISESTFKRAVRAGRLVAADTSELAHVYLTADLFTAEAGFISRRTTGGSSANRYAHSTLSDVHQLFRAVIAYAKAEGVAVQPGVRRAGLPKNQTPKVRARALKLEEAARIAARLHVVHQLVLWLLMLLGLRVSEAYGILVDDVFDRGPGEHGIVIIQSMGGRKFRRRRADKSVATTDHVDETKGKKSNRVLVVPAALMDLIRVVIRVFHTDEFGQIREGARLVPGLKDVDKGGQSAFRHAMKTGAAAESIDITFDSAWRGDGGAPKVTPTPQRLRQSYASVHHADLVPVEDIRATLGQNLGDTVLHLNYLIDDVDLTASSRIADATQARLDVKLGGRIMVPTNVPCTTERQPSLASRRVEIEAKLIETGWWTDGIPAGDWLDVADVATYLGISQHQVRADIRAGKLAAIREPRPDQGGGRYLVSAADLREREAEVGPSDMTVLAQELGVPYDAVRQLVRRHEELVLVREPGRRDGVLSDEADAFLREYFSEQTALRSRAVRLTDVAKELKFSVASIDTLIRRGELVEDIRFHGGFRSLTRSSVEAFKSRGARRRRR